MVTLFKTMSGAKTTRSDEEEDEEPAAKRARYDELPPDATTLITLPPDMNREIAALLDPASEHMLASTCREAQTRWRSIPWSAILAGFSDAPVSIFNGVAHMSDAWRTRWCHWLAHAPSCNLSAPTVLWERLAEAMGSAGMSTHTFVVWRNREAAAFSGFWDMPVDRLLRHLSRGHLRGQHAALWSEAVVTTTIYYAGIMSIVSVKRAIGLGSHKKRDELVNDILASIPTAAQPVWLAVHLPALMDDGNTADERDLDSYKSVILYTLANDPKSTPDAVWLPLLAAYPAWQEWANEGVPENAPFIVRRLQSKLSVHWFEYLIDACQDGNFVDGAYRRWTSDKLHDAVDSADATRALIALGHVDSILVWDLTRVHEDCFQWLCTPQATVLIDAGRLNLMTMPLTQLKALCMHECWQVPPARRAACITQLRAHPFPGSVLLVQVLETMGAIRDWYKA
jgi:hypothetical protein